MIMWLVMRDYSSTYVFDGCRSVITTSALKKTNNVFPMTYYAALNIPNKVIRYFEVGTKFGL